MKTGLGVLLRLIAKQQTTALIATIVDYLVMIALASGCRVWPAVATTWGCLVGGVVSFTLSRRWVFVAEAGSRFGQAWRYAAVSLASLAANAVGEEIVVRLGLHYVFARVVVSLAVGLGWNLPMQRQFVFSTRSREK